jgi:hypothetical protein
VVKISSSGSLYFWRYGPWKTRFMTNHEINYLSIFDVIFFSKFQTLKFSESRVDTVEYMWKNVQILTCYILLYIVGGS